jgi:hypothetical protein
VQKVGNGRLNRRAGRSHIIPYSSALWRVQLLSVYAYSIWFCRFVNAFAMLS